MYKILTILWYLIFISYSALGHTPGRVPYLPNPLLYSIYFTFSFYLTSVSTELQKVTHGRRWMVIRMFLSLIPTMLAMILIFRWIKQQRDNNMSREIYLGPLLIALIFAVLSVPFTTLIVLIFLVDPIPYHGLYLFTILVFWAMIGITLGEIIKINKLQNSGLQKKFKLLYMRRNYRLAITLFIIVLFLIISFFTNFRSFEPISYDYTVDEPIYIGNQTLINEVELLADELFTTNFTGSTAPAIIGTEVLRITHDLSILNYGFFHYTAALVGINATLQSLINNASLVSSPNSFNPFNYTLDENNQFIYQYLEDPFGFQTHVRSVILLENNIPILWVTNNFDWSDLV